MFLNYGKNKAGDLISVSEVKSGKTDLLCPFCKVPLIAKKGSIKDHHFAHNGDTCKESQAAMQASELALFDTFTPLNRAELNYLEKRSLYTHEKIFSFSGMEKAVESLEIMGVLEAERQGEKLKADTQEAASNLAKLAPDLIINGYPSDQLKLILEALKPITTHSLIECWDDNRRILKTTITAKYKKSKFDNISLMTFQELDFSQSFWLNAQFKRLAHYSPNYLNLFKARIAEINKQNLYVMQFDDLIKIGMTTRETSDRLKEVKAALKNHIEVKKATVLTTVKNAGRLEKLLHQKYNSKRQRIGAFTEFFKLSDNEIKLLIDELSNTDIQKYLPPEIPQKIEAIEAKKIAGRKKKTSQELILEYPQIAELLRAGTGIRETARQTSSSVNTVQKVKAALTA